MSELKLSNVKKSKLFDVKKRKLLEYKTTIVTCGVKFCRGCKGILVPSSPEDRGFYCVPFGKDLKYKSIGGCVRCKECLKAEKEYEKSKS